MLQGKIAGVDDLEALVGQTVPVAGAGSAR
jgi:hypothetical protein